MPTTVDKGPPWWRSSRYLLAALSCWGYANFFFQRVNMSMAIVCMVNHTAVDILTYREELHDTTDNASDVLSVMQTYENESSTATVADCRNHFNETEKEDGELVWSKEMQGILLGGFYWGYMVLQFPSQRVSQRTGAKYLALAMTFVLSTLSMVIPVVSRASPWGLMCLRLIQGISAALGIPAMYGMWGCWAPLEERTTLLSWVFTGGMVASSITYPISGLLCRAGFAGGWPSVYYVFGIVGFLWCILWAFLAFETPETHPRIHPKEREYILQNRGGSSQNVGSVPWMKILKSVPVWAVVVAQLGFNWPFFMLLSVLPQYMKEVLKFDIQSNGLYIMMPYIALYLFTNSWACVCRMLSSKDMISVLNIRKLSGAVGDIIPAVLFIIISYVECDDAIVAVILMTGAISISGANYQCFLVNPYDIAPKYSTAILSLSNSVSMAAGIISPYVVAALTTDKTREQWQLAFFLTSAICVVCLLFYLVFGSATEMEWTKATGPDVELEIPVEENELLKEKDNVEGKKETIT